ncbi:MAG: hypothetical protein HDR15_08310 [Lachnospiraceae bacterium]|nr:hypothetical protein [Lachnospiraceae bacterium]
MRKIKSYCKMMSTAIWLILFSLGKTISCDYKLPVFRNGIYITWKSKTPALIDDRGKIHFNHNAADIKKIHFIATLSVGKSYFSDEIMKFQLTIPLCFGYKALTLNERIQSSLDEITYQKILGANKDRKNVISDLTLMKKSSYGIDIVWLSSDKKHICGNIVTRGTKDNAVSLTAQMRLNGNIVCKKEFHLVVKALCEKDTKLLIMVPHGDDEVFLTCNMIRKAVLDHVRVYICFYCNNDTKGIDYAVERHKEALHVLGYLGVKRERIFCLGYSTKWKQQHIYNVADTVSTSINGNTHTYGSRYIKDWRTLKTGKPAAYTRENVIIDICDVISSILPEFIITNDFDKHPDHTAYSLLFEEAMGTLLKKNNDYRPVVYKGFVYSTGAYQKPDFFRRRLPYTHKPSRKDAYYPMQYMTELENPCLCWNDRIRIKTDKELLNRNVYHNPAICALIMYRRMYRNIPCFIKKDCVFWQRRTDNLMLGAKITASSGNADFLNDFMLTDVKKLNTAPYEFNDGEWIPNESDRNKEISILFSESVDIGVLRFYRNRGEMYVKKILITANNQYRQTFDLFCGDVPYCDVKLGIRTNSLKIKILERCGKRIGFTELEAYHE